MENEERNKEIARTIENEEENYRGRVVSRKPNFFSGFFSQPRNRVYYLEVQNKINGKIKRKKVGYGGVALVGTSVVFYDTAIQSIDFTEQGLEAVVRYAGEDSLDIFSPENISEGKLYLIPRRKFPQWEL